MFECHTAVTGRHGRSLRARRQVRVHRDRLVAVRRVVHAHRLRREDDRGEAAWKWFIQLDVLKDTTSASDPSAIFAATRPAAPAIAQEAAQNRAQHGQDDAYDQADDNPRPVNADTAEMLCITKF